MVAVMLVAAPGRAEPASEASTAAIKAGGQIDKDCLKRDVINEIGACRFAATGEQREPAAMLGLYFHMWFSDAVLAELYRTRNAELSSLFERLADAEFQAVAEYEASIGI